MPIAYNNSNNKQKLSVLIPDSANGTDVLEQTGECQSAKGKEVGFRASQRPGSATAIK